MVVSTSAEGTNTLVLKSNSFPALKPIAIPFKADITAVSDEFLLIICLLESSPLIPLNDFVVNLVRVSSALPSVTVVSLGKSSPLSRTKNNPSAIRKPKPELV